MDVDVVSEGHDELFEVLKDAASEMILGQVAEEALDMFSHEDDVGVKRTWKRLCNSSQRWTRSCLCVE